MSDEDPYLLYCGGDQCRETIAKLQEEITHLKAVLKADCVAWGGTERDKLDKQIAELKLDLEEAYRLNATRYQDGYDAAAGPLAAERIKRLQTLWEGAKKRNRTLLAILELFQEIETDT